MTQYSAQTPMEEPKDDLGGWLEEARDAYQTSSDYFDSSIRGRIEKNQAHFAGRHAPGSKYHSDSYKHRSKGFRPKTRAVIRKNEAAAAVSFFSTQDAVSIEAEHPEDLVQKVSAELNHELLNYRLENTIPWFQTVVGAYQETLNAGVVISHQYWDFQEQVNLTPLNDEFGDSILDEMGEQSYGEDRLIVKDTPRVELRPIENVLFSASADWTDPINSSPYLIDKIPMTIGDVKQRAEQTEKGKTPWILLEDEKLQQGLTDTYDPVRAEREHDREDSLDQDYATSDFATVWVHRNIIKRDGRDWIFYTLGTYHMLSVPVPLDVEYLHLKPGERPYTIGVSILEPHKNYPESLTGLSSGLQQDANDINNLRKDNVALVLNRRYFKRKGARINTRALMNNVPGSVVEMDDVQKDIRVEAPPEVTGSAYQEQDRINMDYDEIAGSFSTSSVGSNRQLNETVGGMSMMSEGANQITEYQLRLFSETWVVPTLKQLVRLEQAYETDEAILALMGEKVQMWKRFGVSQMDDRMIQGDMLVRVNVGFGSTNPTQRINKLTMGLNTVLQFAPSLAGKLDEEEVITEVFGALGYRGVERFFPKDKEPQQPQVDPRMQVEQFKAESSMKLEQMKQQNSMQLQQIKMQESAEDRAIKSATADAELQLAILKMAQEKEMSIEAIKAQLGGQAMKLRFDKEQIAIEAQMKRDMGSEGNFGVGE